VHCSQSGISSVGSMWQKPVLTFVTSAAGIAGLGECGKHLSFICCECVEMEVSEIDM